MPERRIMWAAIGLLIITMVLFGLVMVPRLGEEAVPELTPSAPTRPALAAAATPTPLQTLRPGSTPAAAATSTTATVSQGQAARQSSTAPPGNIHSSTQSPAAPASGPASTGTRSQTPTRSPTPPATAAATSESTPSPAATGTPPPPSTTSPTPTPSLTAVPTTRPTATPTRQQTPAPGRTATPSEPGISGRVLFYGQPVEPELVLVLEDQSFNQIAEAKVEDDGWYLFSDTPPAADGYNITFSWEDNQQYGPDEVIAWGWIGPVAYDGQSAVLLPDLEIGLLGLEHIQPEPDTSMPAASISPGTPLAFAWSPHPATTRYWVDLLSDTSFERVWHSALAGATSADFQGQLDDGSRVEPDSYWWAVGGRGTQDGFDLTVYGRLAALTLTP